MEHIVAALLFLVAMVRLNKVITCKNLEHICLNYISTQN